MDAYDEIFDFLNVSQDQRIACLKHLLNSTRAKLAASTKGKIYDRVVDFDAPRQTSVSYVVKQPSTDNLIDSDTDSNPDDQKKILKDKRFASPAAETLATDNNLTAEIIQEFFESHLELKEGLKESKKNKILKEHVEIYLQHAHNLN